MPNNHHELEKSDSQFPISELWYTRCSVPTTSGIAWHYKWLQEEFERQGIELRSLRTATSREERASHYTHSSQGQFREGGNIPAIWTRGEGEDTAVVGITWVDEQQAILVRPDSDIKKVSDLRGRKLGLAKYATTYVDVIRAMDLHGFVTALNLAGLKPADVQFTHLDAPEVQFLTQEDVTLDLDFYPTVDALLQGEVDAIYIKGAPAAAAIEKHGLRVVLDINAHPDPFVRVNNGTPRPITVNRELAFKHPDIVAQYLAVLLQTARWAENHPAEVVKAVAAETGTSAQNVIRGYTNDVHRRFWPSLSAEYVKGLEIQTHFLVDWGFARKFDFPSWIVPEPLALAEKLVANAPASAPVVELH
jgi:sulfonate transport system substrate-binding protein